MEDKNKDHSMPAVDPNDLRQHFEFAHAIGVAMRNNCPTVPEELKNSMLRELSKKAKANKSNWEKNTLFHHSGSRPFSYRMEARRQNNFYYFLDSY
ncbi:hypothetical protein D8674_021379 [Pyrus ussuriensis x Pyrus communis]|uniref:Uncharacterized protein n=1 Tax=Pyrus ussuriensis x Pyrus communis TaxID=2448454 RepID=A0A5N5GLQ0_9ROSA|nr:hypothetical protein D8674_021379 [Pyrus ussuriensis x Pyrus communis]